MADGTISKIQLPDNTIYDVVDNTSGYMTGMTILSYGSSTWQNFIDAYGDNKVVYCRASSNSNPASGSQTRLAFMAYVNNATTPTNVEFQYYRSVSSHTASQQGDQVFVYKLDKTAGWSVTVREASVKVVAGTGLGGTYSNGTMTLTGPTKVSDLTNDSGFITGYTETDPIFTASAAHGISSSDITSWNGKQAALVSGTNIKTINNESLLGSGNITINVDDEIYIVSSSTAPAIAYTNVTNALNNGKIIFLDYEVNGVHHYLQYHSTAASEYYFSGILEKQSYTVVLGSTYWGNDLETLQNELTSGTNIKTINGNSILGSGNLTINVDDEIFVAEYDLTPYSNVEDAYSSGKTIFCKYESYPTIYYLPLTFYDPQGFIFSSFSLNDDYFVISLDSTDIWSFANRSPKSIPTANTMAKFDSSAHMNSTDMTTGVGGEVEDFIDSLNVGGNSPIFVRKDDALFYLDTTSASGTVDGDLYASIVALNWQTNVIE